MRLRLSIVGIFFTFYIVFAITNLSFAGNLIGVVKVEEGSSLRMRDYASLDAEVLASLKPGTEVIVNMSEKLSGRDWYRIVAPNGQEGWVAGDYLSVADLNYSFNFSQSDFRDYNENRFTTPNEKIDLQTKSIGLDKVLVEIFPADRSFLFNHDQQHRKITQETPLNQFALSIFGGHITLPAESMSKPGVYILRASAYAHPLDFAVIIISRLGIIHKISPRNVLVYTVDLETNEPYPNVKVELYQGKYGEKNKPVASGMSDKDGLFIADISGGITYITGSIGDDYELCSIYGPEKPRNYTAYVYTDRPVYRPGNTVNFKGIVRKNGDGVYLSCPNKALTVKIQAEGTLVSTQNLSTNELGTFSGNFVLDSEPKLGYYQIITTIDNESTDSITNCQFRVQEYRKPEYQVTITPSKNVFVKGEKITADLKATYFFGKPVANAKVRIYLFENYYGNDGDKKNDEYEYQSYADTMRLYSYPEVIETDYSSDSEEEDAPPPEDAVALEFTNTDEDGIARIKIPASSALTYGISYRLLATVSDESNREASGSCEIAVVPGAFKLGVSAPRSIYSLGDMIDATVTASPCIKGEAIDGLVVNARVWIVNMNEALWEGKLKTDSQGKADLKLNVPMLETRFAQVIVDLTSTDRFGNEITSKWLCDISDEQGTKFVIYPDKEVYSPGEKAKITILSPVKADNDPVLVTVEGRKIHAGYIIRLSGTSTTMEIPITSDFEPNVFFSACMVKDMGFYPNEFRDGYESFPEGYLNPSGSKVHVPPREKFLNIAVNTEKPEYRPGENVTYTIKTTDNKGKPVSSEVSLGVVDTSIYALHHELAPDIKRYFYGSRENTVYTGYSFGQLPGVEGGEGMGEVSIVQRTNLLDTAFWNAHVLTDENGTADVSFKLPDNITSWRATVRGVTADTKVGSWTSEVISTKRMFIRLLMPRFLTQGDKLSILTIVHNYSGSKQDVLVKFQAQGVKLMGDSQQKAVITPDGTASFPWEIVVDNIGTAKFIATVQSEALSDGIEMSIPILPHGIEQYTYVSGSLDGAKNSSEEITLTLPKDRLRGASSLKLTMAPSLASTMFTALDYLVSYPYG